MNNSVIGLDIAKIFFHMYSLTAENKVYKKQLQRANASLLCYLPNKLDRDRSLWWCALLGKRIDRIRA